MANGDAQHHILTVLVENKFGVLSRVAGLFARRGFNIVSLAVSPTEDERFSRMTIVVDAESAPLEQVTKQLNKLIPVIKITELHARRGGRARADAGDGEGDAPRLRSQITELASIFEAKIVDVGYDAITIMVAGRARQARRDDRPARSRSASSSSSAPGRIALPKLARRPARLRAVKTRTG